MNVIAKIMTSEQFEFNGQRFVKIQGFINGLGLFQQSVKEELVPDGLEGKECCLMFKIGLVNFKPSLKLVGISLDTNLVDIDKE